MKMVTTTTGENRAEVEWYTQWGLVWWERKIGTGEFSRLTQEQLAQIQASRSKSEGISPGAATLLLGAGALLIFKSLLEGGSHSTSSSNSAREFEKSLLRKEWNDRDEKRILDQQRQEQENERRHQEWLEIPAWSQPSQPWSEPR